MRHYRAFRVSSLRTGSGSLAMFAAIRLASSLVSNFAAERRPAGAACVSVGKG
jgi:hypothetical protein